MTLIHQGIFQRRWFIALATKENRLTLNSAGQPFQVLRKQFSNYNSTNNFKWYTTFVNLQRSYKAIEVYNNVAASANSILCGAQSHR
jgi:hypothetical protein